MSIEFKLISLLPYADKALRTFTTGSKTSCSSTAFFDDKGLLLDLLVCAKEDFLSSLLTSLLSFLLSNSTCLAY
jgi:hypothetical protein